MALIKAKIVYNFGLSECNWVHLKEKKSFRMHALPSIFFFQMNSLTKMEKKTFRVGVKKLG